MGSRKVGTDFAETGEERRVRGGSHIEVAVEEEACADLWREAFDGSDGGGAERSDNEVRRLKKILDEGEDFGLVAIFLELDVEFDLVVTEMKNVFESVEGVALALGGGLQRIEGEETDGGVRDGGVVVDNEDTIVGAAHIELGPGNFRGDGEFEGSEGVFMSGAMESAMRNDVGHGRERLRFRETGR